MKKITKITKEQKAQIPIYIKKWIDLASQPIDREKSWAVITEIYKDRKPLILFTESFENTLNLIKFVLSKAKVKKIERGSQLYSQLDSQLNSQLHSQLSSQLDSQLISQLNSQLNSQLISQLRSQLHSQLSSQLDSQLISQLRSQLHSQLHSQLDSQLDSQLGSQLGSQLDSQLYSQLYSQLDSQLYSQLGSQLYSQLDSQLDSQLGSQLDSQLYSQLDSQLDSQLYSQLDSEEVNWSWYISYFWLSCAGYYDYAKYIGVEFDVDKLEKYIDIILNAPIVVFIGNIIFICEKPQIIWNANGVIHSETKQAISWKDETGFYYLNGVKFEKDLWQQVMTGKMSFSEILKIENTEQRLQAMRYNPKALLKENPKLISKTERGNELYVIENSEVNKIYDEPKVYLLGFIDPSKRAPNNKFYEEVSPELGSKASNADEVNAVHCGLTYQEYNELRYET